MGAGLGTQAGGVGPSVFEEGRGLVGRTPLEEGVVSVWVLGPRGQGCSPSREEASREPGVKEDGERLSLGSPGWEIRERSALFWGGDPFGDLGIHGGPWREVTELGATLTLKKAMLFPRWASDSCDGLSMHSHCRGGPRGAGSASAAALHTPPSNAGSVRT